MHRPRHDVVVIGAGNGGLATAARLIRRGCPDVAIVEPAHEHVYTPLQNYAGLGLVDDRRLARPNATLIPDAATWHRTEAIAIDPDRRVVTCANGDEVAGADIVIAAGARIDWDALPGAAEALATGPAVTTFDRAMLPRTRQRIAGLRGGRALFTLHDQPASGRETAMKPLLMACDRWRADGVLDGIEVELIHEGDRLHHVQPIEQEWRRHLDRYGVVVRPGIRLVAIEGNDAILESDAGRERRAVDLLHLLPPYAAPGFVADSGLDGPGTDGFVDVDAETLQHRRYPRIWAVGDAADLGDGRTGGALRHQTPIVVENIRAARAGAPLQRYDGYTVAPVTASRRSLSFAEYDRAGALRRSLPVRAIDEVHASPLWFALDRFVLPRLYWRGIVRGRA